MPETVVVVGKRERPLSRIAARVTVLDSQRLHRTLSGDIREAVRYEPGLSVPSDPIRFGPGSFRIRGIGGNRVAGEIDGVPVPEGFAVGSYADSGRNFVALDFVDQIEVLRGPASSLYGSDAIAGVVAIDTIDPADLAPVADHVVETRVDYASHDDGRSTALLGALRGNVVELAGGLVYRTAGQVDIAGGTRPDPREFASTSALGKILWPEAAGGGLELTVTGERADSRTDVQALLGLPGRFVNTFAMRAHDESQRLRISAEQRLSSTPVIGSGLWRLYFQRSAVQQFTREDRSAVPPRSADPLVIERFFELDAVNWGGELTAEADAQLGGWQHELVYGAEFDVTRIEERRDGRAIDPLTLTATQVILGESFPLRDFPRTDLRKLGVFVQDDLRSPDDSWSLIPALRVDYYLLEPETDPTYAKPASGRDPVALDTWSLSPKFGVIYRIGDAVSVFAQYARGFRAPPFADVNIGLDIPRFNIRAIPNPDLEPETSDGLELGARVHQTGWWFEASVYRTDFDNFIESKVNLGPDPASGVVLFQSRNVAEARIYGFEASLATSAEHRPPGWAMYASLAWSRGEDLSNHAPLMAVDPAKLVVAATYGSKSGRWDGELVLTAVDRKRGLNDRRDDDLHATDGYVTLDLLGHYQGHTAWSVDVALLNLTDARYQQWADVSGHARDDPLLPYYVQPGRSISVGLTWRY